MRIKKVDIVGFKSFADKTSLLFGEGITGIVGPNGCGKSNVVDAIRWCMGEMSAKNLRGRGMQDVIFAGSDSRGPLGLAEVTLTLRNDGDVPPQYAAFSEIAVTRRLHKDGTSEYLVNKVPARLRDITDLFLGTGVGTRAYSIIEQGRIGFIVSSRPEDRRSLIEEVAGITKFKVRKKAAERRLEATEQNLARVNDIVAELERQLASLERQAKKAERYKRVRTELRELDLHAAALGYLEATVLERQQSAELSALEQQLTDGEAERAAAEASIEADRLKLLADEQGLQALQTESAELDAKVAALERDLSHWSSQAIELDKRVQAARADVEVSRAREAEAKDERARLTEELATVEAEQARGEGALRELADVVAQKQAELSAIDRDIEARRKLAFEHVHGLAQQRSLAQHLARQRADIEARLASAKAERDELGHKLAAANDSEGTLAGKCAEVQRELAAWSERLSSLRADIATLGAELASDDLALADATSELTQRRSRLTSLEEIARRLEGYSDGVRTLLGAGEDGQVAVAGLRALVADVFSASPEYERAIEAALGERIQYLVVDSHDDAARAIAHLKEAGGGKSGFLPVRPRLGEPWQAMAVLPGVLGTARTFVDVKPGYDDVAEVLLGDVLVVDQLSTALSLWAQGATDARLTGKAFVTTAGEVVDPAGAVLGGSSSGAGLLAQGREIRELKELVKELDEALARRRAAYDVKAERRLQLEVSAQQLDKDIRAGELEKLDLEKDVQAARKEVQRLSERVEVLGYELAQRDSELSAIGTDEKSAREGAALAESNQQAVESELGQLGERRAVLVRELDERTGALTAARVDGAARDEKLVAARAQVRRLSQAIDELGARIEKDLSDIAAGEAQAAQLGEQAGEGKGALATLVDDARARRDALAKARATYDRERQGLAALEQAQKEQRRAADAVREATMSARMELQRLALGKEQLVAQVLERHDVGLLDVLTDYHLRAAPGPEELARKEELERSLKAMGPVNLAAIEEHTEVEQRHTFLVKQRDDLAHALESLRRAIQRINKASRERFLEAFNAVNDMFQQVFPRLFRGGEARLSLVESEDLLEAGVEIVAMPPGKKPQSVSLLSGGEKALTATALVFAIFLIKPSPFCVLDEVDAPLDEANVGRFTEMLREISKISQFIVITHNKLTMSEADRLYGVTQEELGVSKIVSVDLKQKGEKAA